MKHLKIFENFEFTKVWKEIPVSFYKNSKKDDLLKFNNKEIDKISNMGGLGKKSPKQYNTFLTSNCYSCHGSGLESNSYEPCYDCRGRGYKREREMEAIKISDGYYLIYYEDKYNIKSFEIDGFSNFLKYWKILYLHFTGNKINKSDFVDSEFMNLFEWK